MSWITLHNPMTCEGWGAAPTSLGLDFGPCMTSRLGAVILFFVIAIIRKWGGEEAGIEFNFWMSIGAGMLSYFIAIILFGNTGLAFFVGLIFALAAGYGAGFFMGGDDAGSSI